MFFGLFNGTNAKMTNDFTCPVNHISCLGIPPRQLSNVTKKRKAQTITTLLCAFAFRVGYYIDEQIVTLFYIKKRLKKLLHLCTM